MAKMVEGARVMTAAASANVSAANHNEIQDQIIGVFQENDIAVPLTPVVAEANWSWTDGATPGLNPGYWVCSSGGDDVIEFPVPGLRQGMVITDVKLSLWREVDNETEGDITIVAYALGVGASAPANAVTAWTSTGGWDFGTGGSQYGRVDEALTYTVLGAAHYRVQFTAPTTASAHEVRVYGINLRVQLGN